MRKINIQKDIESRRNISMLPVVTSLFEESTEYNSDLIEEQKETLENAQSQIIQESQADQKPELLERKKKGGRKA